MIRERREVCIFQKFVCQRFLKSDRRLTWKVLIHNAKKKRNRILTPLCEKIIVDRESLKNVRAKPTFLNIDFSAVMTSS